jgi:hypothetical protein
MTFGEFSKAEKVTLTVVLALVVLVIISWAADGFAFSVTGSTEHGNNLGQIFGDPSMTTNVNHSEDEHDRI